MWTYYLVIYTTHLKADNELIETEWRIKASVLNLALIGSDNCLASVWRQGSIWTNDGLLLIGSVDNRTPFYIHHIWYLDNGVASSPPGQNDRHFADDFFKCNFVNEMFCILIPISLNFVPKVPIDNKSTLVEVMAWRRTGAKPLPQPMPSQFTDAYMRH